MNVFHVSLNQNQHVHQNSYRLHAIILSRSPFLAHLMSTSPQTGGQRVIYVQLDHEPEVTHEVRLFRILVMSPFISATVCGQWLSRS